jgi:hypothetical protein
MPPDAHKGACRFDTLWKLPTHMVGSISFTGTDRSNVKDELETNFMRDVVKRTAFLMHTINVKIKYTLSDLEVTLNNSPNQLSVTGPMTRGIMQYIQKERQKKIESGNLLRWIQTYWSSVTSVDGQLVRNESERRLSPKVPACHRHARSRQETGVCSPPNLEFPDLAWMI